MKFLFLEPFYGGSHRDFADGLVSHSRHEFDLITLPARAWKWRLRGAALHLIKKIPPTAVYHGLITSDLMSLSDFKTLWGSAMPPCLVYFHESQFTYPLAPGEQMDYQFGFTDITTCLAADRILFNSYSHYDSFFDSLPGFIRMMPDYRPNWVVDAIRGKSAVQYPGCRFPTEAVPLDAPQMDPPLIIWNHRWEFDKNPKAFFAALEKISLSGIDFRLALLGENYQVRPKVFLRAQEKFGQRIVRFGYEPDKKKYRRWLARGAIVVSTADQENFGISVIEAVRYGCIPLLPNRLSYPEILPREFHADFLYSDEMDLEKKLSRLIANYSQYMSCREILAGAMATFAWEKMIIRYDEELKALARLRF
jgi:glycosyltransferase involved in cell wall biosynthesis